MTCRGCENDVPLIGTENEGLKSLRKHCKNCPNLSIQNPSHHPFACLKCSYTCSRGFNMTQHLRRHIGKSYVCQQCRKRFTTNFGLQKHLKSHAGNQFACTLCGQLEDSKSSLYNHYSSSHGVDKSSKECLYCGEVFKRIDSYQRHLLQKHKHVQTKNTKTIKISMINDEIYLGRNSNSTDENSNENTDENDTFYHY